MLCWWRSMPVLNPGPHMSHISHHPHWTCILPGCGRMRWSIHGKAKTTWSAISWGPWPLRTSRPRLRHQRQRPGHWCRVKPWHHGLQECNRQCQECLGQQARMVFLVCLLSSLYLVLIFPSALLKLASKLSNSNSQPDKFRSQASNRG